MGSLLGCTLQRWSRGCVRGPIQRPTADGRLGALSGAALPVVAEVAATAVAVVSKERAFLLRGLQTLEGDLLLLVLELSEHTAFPQES